MTTRDVVINSKTITDTDWAYSLYVFELLSEIAVAGSAVYPASIQQVGTDANGSGVVSLAVPDSNAWQYKATLPNGSECIFALEAGASITLAEIIANGCSDVVPAPDYDLYVKRDGSNAKTGNYPNWRFWIQPQTIAADEVVVIPSDHQMVVFGGLAIDAGGHLIIEGSGGLVAPA